MSDLSAGLQSLESLHDRQQALLKGEPGAIPDSLESLQSSWGELEKEFLLYPSHQLDRTRLLKQTVAAFHRYGQGLDDLARTSSRMVQVTGQQLSASLSSDAQRSSLLAGFSKRSRPLYVRSFLLYEVQRSVRAFQPLATAYLATVTMGATSLSELWKTLTNQWCWGILNDAQPTYPDRIAWNRTRARKCLQAIDRHASKITRNCARHLLRAHGKRPGKTPPRDNSTLRGERWASLLGDTQSAFALNKVLALSMKLHIRLFRRLDESLDNELLSLRGELNSLEEWAADLEGNVETPPARVAQITPSSNRLTNYRETLKSGLNGIARAIHSTPQATREPLPDLLRSAAESDEGLVESFLELVENDHRRLLQALEQAREVVTHSSQSHSSELSQILHEAGENVVSLLQYWKDFEPEWKRQISLSACTICAGFLLEVRNRCEPSLLRRIRYRGQRFSRSARERGDGLGEIALLVGRRLLERSSGLVNAFLMKIGWSASPPSEGEAIVRRPYLPEQLAVASHEEDIPAIYRRLFNIESVSDPRFLVGRERELAALDEAYRWWMDDRPVSVVITGHRGSGKTSLLNCAFRDLPSDVTLVRGDFCDRVTSVEGLVNRIGHILGLEPEAQLEEELDRCYRVIILEEVERTFLRKIGGYEAARHLLRLIARSGRTTLWVLGMNRVAFQLLHAALNFGDPFSHRIDTAAVKPEVLRQAVISRHNLSGLRLHLPKPENARWWRPNLDSEAEYFKTFSSRTDGVFRTAFEIWQGHVEKVQAGVMFMLPIAQRSLSDVVEVLDLGDLFALVAIIQHGSLTADELAQIISQPTEICQAQLDELVSRELIHPDPRYPGLRIRPEAAPIVRAVLYQKNLI